MTRSHLTIICLATLTALALPAPRFAHSAPVAPAPPAPSAAPVGTAKVAPAPLVNRSLPASRLTNRRTLLSRRAMGFRSARYVFGAANLRSTDCSGLTMQLYRSVGIALPHSARSQYHYGRTVSRKDLLPGDLVFFGRSRGISHVGMFIGNGKMIHAANPRKGVRIDALSSSWYVKRFVGARRLLKEGMPSPELPSAREIEASTVEGAATTPTDSDASNGSAVALEVPSP